MNSSDLIGVDIVAIGVGESSVLSCPVLAFLLFFGFVEKVENMGLWVNELLPRVFPLRSSLYSIPFILTLKSISGSYRLYPCKLSFLEWNFLGFLW